MLIIVLYTQFVLLLCLPAYSLLYQNLTQLPVKHFHYLHSDKHQITKFSSILQLFMLRFLLSQLLYLDLQPPYSRDVLCGCPHPVLASTNRPFGALRHSDSPLLIWADVIASTLPRLSQQSVPLWRDNSWRENLEFLDLEEEGRMALLLWMCPSSVPLIQNRAAEAYLLFY